MVVVQPFVGSIVKNAHVQEVASPAYDALTVAQRIAYRADHPLSYLHVTRSAADEPDADTVDHATLAARGKTSLETLIAAEVFASLAEPGYVVYELEADGHRQRGLLCEVAGSEFAAEALPHEGIEEQRAALLAEHFAVVGAASSPVACTTGFGCELAAQLGDLGQPRLEHQSVDGLTQRVWILDADRNAAIEQALAGEAIYIVDGHHRAAANKRLLGSDAEPPVLAAIFPPTELHLAAFHRLVRLPESLSFDGFMHLVERRFGVEPLQDLRLPEPGSVAIADGDRFFAVRFDERPIEGDALIRLGSLDPSVVEREILDGIVGRFADRVAVTYRPDVGSLEEIVEHARAEGCVAILVPPVDLADMFAVADGDHVMPAKSTYFVPKVRSGIFLRIL